MPIDVSKLMALASGKKAEIASRSGQFNRTTKIPDGSSRWRILPGWRPGDEATFFHDFGQHFVRDGNGSIKGVFICRAATFGEACDCCDHVQDVRRLTKDDAELKKIGDFKASNSFLVNAVRVDGAEANPTKPVLLLLPQSVMTAYLDLLKQRQLDDEINLLDPIEGRNVTITKEGQGFNVTYSLTDAAKNSAVDPAALDNLINIDDYISGEETRGRPNTAKFLPALRTTAANLGLSYTPGAAAISPPAAAALSAPKSSGGLQGSRVIAPEPIDDEVPFVNDEPKEPVKPAKPAATKPAPKPAPEPEPADEEIGDDELQAMMKQLEG